MFSQIVLMFVDFIYFEFSFTCRVIFVKVLHFDKDETKIEIVFPQISPNLVL